jgi:sigma-B regulation protein RsbU (phosphoserine phosphatase)
MRPADEVGGDYYDVLPTPDGGAWIAIGDVAGHGLNAGIVMMMVQTAVAALVRERPDAKPSQHLTALNDVIYENVRNRLGSERHVTLSLMRYQPDGSVQVAGAHLDLTVWRKATGKCELLATKGTWISLTENIAPSTSDDLHKLEPDDVLVLCTDGITEAMDDAGEQFGFERVIREVEARPRAPVGEICDAIMSSARGFCRVQLDDMTLLVIRYRDVAKEAAA